MENEASDGLFSDNYNDDEMFQSNSKNNKSPANDHDFLGSMGKKSSIGDKKE